MRQAGAALTNPAAMLDISPLTTHDGLDRLLPEWTELYDESCVRNPFAHPEWLLAWARHFVAASSLHVLAVRCGGRPGGVAPLHPGPGPAPPGLAPRRAGRIGRRRRALARDAAGAAPRPRPSGRDRGAARRLFPRPARRGVPVRRRPAARRRLRVHSARARGGRDGRRGAARA